MFFASLTRITDLSSQPLVPVGLPRGDWAPGDYVVGEVLNQPGPFGRAELSTGRMVDVHPGDWIVGALGVRAATLELTGSWDAVGEDLIMDALTPAGLMGRITSASHLIPEQPRLLYRGHITVDGRKATMAPSVTPVAETAFTVPVVLVVGTSMSAGKTSAARVLIRLLKAAGYRVVGAKLTGAARYRDILEMGDAGADHILDFVDAGLPSTVCPPQEYRKALHVALSQIARWNPDVAVVEAGASPLEPYNGAVAVSELDSNIKMTVLCASDPYAALGVMEAFGRRPHLVSGPATNTDSGVALVHQLTGARALNLHNREVYPQVSQLLEELLEQPAHAAGPRG